MAAITLLSILISILFSVCAQILLKHGMSKVVIDDNEWLSVSYSVATNSFVILGLVCYGLSMVVWLYVLSKVEVSKAYPFVGLGFIGTMVFANYFLSEPITVPKLFGTLMIVAGVFLIAK